MLCPVPMAAGFCPGLACNEVFVTTFTPADVGTGDVNGVTDGFQVDPPLIVKKSIRKFYFVIISLNKNLP